jgi:hypothetical protein
MFYSKSLGKGVCFLAQRLTENNRGIIQMFIKRFEIFAIFALMFALCIPISAASSGTVEMGATNTSASDISVAAAGTAITTLGTVAHSDVLFGTITLDSNAANGFTINFSSTGTVVGKLAIGAGGTNKEIAYTMSMVDIATGTLGSTPGTLPSDASLTGVGGDNAVSFSTPTAATEGYVYNLTYSTAQLTSLLAGTFAESVSVEIVEI